MRNRASAAIGAAMAVALVLCGVGCAAAPGLADLRAPHPRFWTGSWTASPLAAAKWAQPPAPGLASNTLRQVVHLSIGGDWLRLRLSNQFGQTPLQIESVHMALPAGAGAIQPGTDRAVGFGGLESVSIPPGAWVWSDPVYRPVAPGHDLSVSLYFGAVPTEITGHPVARATSYLQTANEVGQWELASPTTADHWYVLNGVDVATRRPGATLIAFGDSITDGDHSSLDRNARWPDDLARRLAAAGMGHIAVLNEGIAGNRLLDNSWGPGALARLDDEALSRNGVRWMVLLEGINDIGNDAHPETGELVDQMIVAYRQIADRAHAHGIRIFVGTLMPFDHCHYYTPNPGREVERQRVNQWIRHSSCFDGVIDFDLAMRDPANPTSLLAAYDSGDHLHPGDAGYQHMADIVLRRLFGR